MAQSHWSSSKEREFCACVCVLEVTADGRLQLGENQSLKKADEWCCLMSTAPVLLWEVWRGTTNEIPDTEPPMPPNSKRVIKHSHSPLKIYQAALYLCCAIRILACKTITRNQAQAGQDSLQLHSQLLIRLGAKLHINHHSSLHYLAQIKLFGPVYAWWLFAFERFNGLLEKIRHNGHDGGAMEVTLLRNWVQTHRFYELVGVKTFRDIN